MIWLVLSGTLLYGTTNSTQEPIPKLRPPKGELLPTFWEDYGLVALVGGLLSVLLLGVVLWLLTRPKPVVAPPPSALARRSLESLRGQREDGLLLSRVSRVLRWYLSTAFGLPPQQLTTTEFCGLLLANPGVGSELGAAATDFLRRCDDRKFAPLPPPPPLGAVEAALKLVETAERQLAQQPPSQGPNAAAGADAKGSARS